jgi:hypothetical protein
MFIKINTNNFLAIGSEGSNRPTPAELATSLGIDTEAFAAETKLQNMQKTQEQLNSEAVQLLVSDLRAKFGRRPEANSDLIKSVYGNKEIYQKPGF